ncbi:hypothetical protein OKHIL_69030 [Mycolicibacterium mageritense]
MTSLSCRASPVIAPPRIGALSPCSDAVTDPESDRDHRGAKTADTSAKTGETDSSTTGLGGSVPSDTIAARMTAAGLRDAAAADPLGAEYIKTKRPELADWDF